MNKNEQDKGVKRLFCEVLSAKMSTTKAVMAAFLMAQIQWQAIF